MSESSTKITIAQSHEVEIDKIKGSRFIGFAFPLANIEEMESMVQVLWQQHPDARHVCWAYRGSSPDTIRMVDDGEPSGTAGKPILTVIEGRGLESVGVAVVRYFGGTKLGTGGLARAYSSACQAVLADCKEKYLKLKRTLNIEIQYSFEGSLLYLLEQQEAIIVKREYSDRVMLEAILLSDRASLVSAEMTERTSGQAKIAQSDEFWA